MPLNRDQKKVLIKDVVNYVEKHALSTNELAQRAGLTPHLTRHVLRDFWNPDEETLRKLEVLVIQDKRHNGEIVEPSAFGEQEKERTKSDKPQIYVAIDTSDLETAIDIVKKVGPVAGGVKLGMEFFYANGPQGVNAVMDAVEGLSVFLDLKCYDIPNTVAGAMRSMTRLGVDYVNLHASGGGEMMVRAREALEDEASKIGCDRPKLLGVTVLTSMNENDIEEVGMKKPLADQVKRLAMLSHASEIDGVVCSALEIDALRHTCGPDFVLMVPGIRPVGVDQDDQERITTPEMAIRQGAHHLVIGRPITKANDPARAAQNIVDSIYGFEALPL